LKEITIYTDGSARNNPGPGGYGVVLLFNGKRKELSAGYRKTTNNRMELLAVIEGLQALKEHCKVKIYCDSKYVIEPIQKGWLFSWKVKNWTRGKKEKVKNPDLWVLLDALLQKHDVEFHWVKGHNGNRENDRCDFLAVSASDDKNLLIDENYEKNFFDS